MPGRRFLGGPYRVLYFWHSVRNKVLPQLSSMLTILKPTDMKTCYEMVRAPLLRCLVLTSDRFGLDPEVKARLAQAHGRIGEVPITYSGRTYVEGERDRVAGRGRGTVSHHPLESFPAGAAACGGCDR